MTTCRFCNVVECACRTCLCRQLNVSITLQLGSSAWNNATVIVILHILNVVCKRCENWKALDERTEQFCWNLSDSGEDYQSQSRRMVSLSVNTEILASSAFFYQIEFIDKLINSSELLLSSTAHLFCCKTQLSPALCAAREFIRVSRHVCH